MKRLITFLLMFFAVEANAQIIFYWSDGDYVGGLKTNFNQSMSNVVAAIAGGGVVTTNSHGGGIKIVGSTDSNVFYFLPYFTGSVGVAASLLELSNGVTQVGLAATNAGLGVTQVGLAATNAGLGVTQVGLAATNAGLGVTQVGLAATNALAQLAALGSRTNIPTLLVAGAGYTATVTHADNLWSITATSTPLTLTVDLAALSTGEVWTALVEVEKGTNTLAWPTNVFTTTGRNSWTNINPSSTLRTEILFQKAVGSLLIDTIKLSPYD